MKQALLPHIACINMAKNGRSTSSYRAEGSWDEVAGKPGRSTDLATEFPANLRRYVEEVKAAGAKPMLVTPLTRRSFKDGQVANTLRNSAEAAIRIAAEEHAPVVDLAVLPQPDPKFDYTHLGPKGSAFFGKMVAGELTAAVPDLKPYVTQ